MIRETLDSIRTRAMGLLEECQRDQRPMPPAVFAYRGDEEVAVVIPRSPQQGSGDLVRVAIAATVGFSADVVGLVTDTYKAVVEVNPRTGLEWQGGELQHEVEEHEGIQRGNVIDCLHIEVVNRAGDIAACSISYRPLFEGKRVHWLEPEIIVSSELPESQRLMGTIPSSLRKAMAAPSVSNLFLETVSDFGDLTPEEQVTLGDVLCARALSAHDCAVLMTAEPGSERSRWLSFGLGDIGEAFPPLFTDS